MKIIICLLFNLWRTTELVLPNLGDVVLCYWNEYGIDVYIVCRLTKRNGIVMFEGDCSGVSHKKVTHWKYLSRPINK